MSTSGRLPQDPALAADVQRARADPRRLLGPYVLLEELGRGGMGVVHRAWHERLARVVALKTLAAPGAASPQAVARFQREAEAVARLRHPNIVAIHDVGSAGNQHWIAMDFIRGRNLEQRIKPPKDGARSPERLSLTRALEALRDVSRAVQYAHEEGVVHRDLKPANILLDETGRPFVLDFGLARVRGDVTLTREGTGVGTPAYMPPEQAGGEGGHADERSDVYALGATLYFVLTGRPPFVGETDYNVLSQLLTKDPLPPSAINRRAAGDLETICLRALEKSPERRYATAAAFADDLDAHLAGEPIAARPITGVERVLRTARRNRLAAFLVLALALVVLAAVAAGVVSQQRHTARLEAETAQAVAARKVADEKTAEALHAVEVADQKRAEALRLTSLAEGRLTRAYLQASRRAVADARFGDAALLAAEALGTEGRRGDAPDHAGLLREARVALARAQQGPWRAPVSLFRQSGGLASISATADGARILVASADRVPTVVDLATRDLRHARETVPDGSVVGWDGAGRRIVVVRPEGGGHALVVLDGASLEPAAPPVRLEGLGEARALAFRPDGAVAAVAGKSGLFALVGLDGSPRLLGSRATGKEPAGLAWLPDGALLAAGTLEGKILRFVPEAQGLRELESVAVAGQVETLAPLPRGGHTVVVAFREGVAALVDLDARTERRFEGRLNAIESLSVRGDGRLVAGSSRLEAKVVVWDTATHAVAARLVVPAEVRLAFLGASPRLAVAGREVETWDLSALDSAGFTEGGSRLNNVASGPASGLVAALFPDGRLRVSRRGREGAFEQPADGGVGYRVAVSGKGARVAYSRSDGILGVMDFDQKRGSRVAAPTPVFSIAFSPAGDRLATGGQADGEKPSLCTWDVASGRRVGGIAAHPRNVDALAYSPDGSLVATGGQDQTVKLWTSELEGPLATFEVGMSPTAIAWTSARTLVVAGQSQSLAWLDRDGRAELVPIELPARGTGWIQCGAASPDGSLVAFGAGSTIVLFDGKTRARLADLPHDDVVSSIAFDPARSSLVACTLAGTVATWSTEDLRSLDVPADLVSRIGDETRLRVDERTLEPAPLSEEPPPGGR